MTPACMTPDELRLWHEANLAKRATPCFDCPVAFAEEMRSEGCCNGEPLEGHGGRPPMLERTPLRDQWLRASRNYRARRRGDSPLPATASTMAA